MWLPLLLFLLSPHAVEPNCHDHRYGAPSKSCKRVKDAKFQIRGVKIVPMWEFMLLKEPSFRKRVKRSNARNATLPTANGYYSGGVQQRQFQPFQRGPASLPIQRNAPSYTKTHDASMPAIHHHTLIQPIDSNAPRPVQRHLAQRQVQPSILQSSIFSTNIAHNPRKFKRQENYPTAAPPPQWGNGETGEQEKGEGKKKSKNTKKKHRKGKKKMSKMCKMCKELSAEDSSEEREVACEICRKASKNRTNEEGGGKEEEKRPLEKALKVRPIQKTKNEEDEGSDEEEEGEEAEGQGGNNEEGDDDYLETPEETTESPPSTTTPKPTTTVSQPTIVDYAERAKQNRLMRIPVYRGKSLGSPNETAMNRTDANDDDEEDVGSEFATNIRNETKQSKYSDTPNVKYSYPPKDTLPLQTCFHNPSGYVCCNLDLNNVVESTYKEIREAPNFNPCNLQVIANKVQRASEKMFEHPFESVVSHADFAQNINFAGDLVCKLEIDGKYMIAYGTPYHAENAVGPQGPDGRPLPVRSLKL